MFKELVTLYKTLCNTIRLTYVLEFVTLYKTCCNAYFVNGGLNHFRIKQKEEKRLCELPKDIIPVCSLSAWLQQLADRYVWNTWLNLIVSVGRAWPKCTWRFPDPPGWHADIHTSTARAGHFSPPKVFHKDCCASVLEAGLGGRAPDHNTPNLPTKIIPAQIAWLKLSRKSPVDMRIPPM